MRSVEVWSFGVKGLKIRASESLGVQCLKLLHAKSCKGFTSVVK